MAGTKKGEARKGKAAGSRLAFDDTKQEKKKAGGKGTGGGLAKWRAAVKKANDKLGTKGVPRKGSKAYAEAKKIYGK